MSERTRRTLLATLGTAVVAGCLTDSSDPGTAPAETPADATDTATPTDGTSAGTSPPTETAGTTSTDTGSPAPTTTAQTTDPDPQTPTGSETPATPEPGPEPPSTTDSEWPMPAADAGLTSYAPAAAGPTEPVSELWRVQTGTELFGPVVAGETLYVGGDDGEVRAFDARRGDERWRSSVGDAAGPPRVLDERVFVPTDDSIVALSTDDGTELWRTETPGRVGRRSAIDGVVWLQGMVVATHGVYWFVDEEPTVVALSADDGSQQWRTEVDTPAERPLFAGAEYVFLSSGTHDNRFWRFDPDTGDVLGKRPRGGADFPAEQCYLDGTMYAVDGFFGNVRATAVTDAGNSWSQGVPPQTGGADGRVSGGADNVYYTSNSSDEPDLLALSRVDGTVEWSVEFGPAVVGPPTVASETVLLPTADGLRCHDPSDGTKRWSVSDVDAGESLAVVDDLVYTAVDGAVRAFRAPPYFRGDSG